MTEEEQTLQESSILDLYMKILEEEGIAFELSDDQNVLMLIGDTEAGRCEGYLITDEMQAMRVEEGQELMAEGNFVQEKPVHMAFCEAFYLLPIEELPKERLQALMELILRLNESHRIGAWELHLEDQEIRFRIYQTIVISQDLPRAHMLMPFYEGVRAIDLHWSSFQMVLEQDFDPAHAVAEFYAREALDDEVGIDEELLSRAGQLFEVARHRYQNQNNEAHAHLMGERLESLTRQVGLAVLKTQDLRFSPQRSVPRWNLEN